MGSSIKFGTDGWRAIIAEGFTFENLRLVASGIGNYLMKNNYNKKGIFIGYDNRFLSEKFAEAAGVVLLEKGIENIYISTQSIPTPVTAFNVIDMNLDGAIMITASHNPPAYNGLKFIPYYGGPATDDITGEIEDSIKALVKNDESDYTVSNGRLKEKIKYINDFKNYRASLLKIIDRSGIAGSKIKIAIDTMNGSGSNILPEIIEDDIRIKPEVINNNRDPLFSGKLPDPSEKNLQELKHIVIDEGYHLGIALDGDADRFGVIDGKGLYLSPNNVISIFLYYLLQTRKYDESFKVARTVATTHLIDAICNNYGIKIVETPVGFKYIAQEMIKNKIIVGGEESGGLSIYGHIPEKDGLLACLLLIEIQSHLFIEKTDYFLSDYLNDIYKKFGCFKNTRLDLEISSDKKYNVLSFFGKMLNINIGNIRVAKINDMDGVKLILEDGSWILVRPSGTEPLIRCYIESEDSEYFEFLKNFVQKNIIKISGN